MSEKYKGGENLMMVCVREEKDLEGRIKINMREECVKRVNF